MPVLSDLGFTLTLGTAGSVALIAGQRKLAGLLWTMLGTGAVGVAFERMTAGDLRFGATHKPCREDQRFLLGHIPFFVLGVFLLWQKT
jgi:hypothetical protein